MPAAAASSLSDDDSVFQANREKPKLDQNLTSRASSEPDLNVLTRFPRKTAAKLRKKLLKEFYASQSPRSLDLLLLTKRKRLGQASKEDVESMSYKYGRLAMIALALFSIPVDGWKLYQEVARTERSLDGPTSIEVFDYYSSAITTHVIGLAAALDNSLILTIGCRMLSTVLYQTSYGAKGNSTVPTDPKLLQKYIRENVPAHRLPKGYRFTDDLDSGKAGKTGRGKKAGKRKRASAAKRGSKKSGAKKGKASAKSKKSAKSARTQRPTKAAASKKTGKKTPSKKP